MPKSCPTVLTSLGLILVIITFVLQLLALATSRWATFTARTDLGKPKEDGHYGLWTICSIKGPHWTETCDPMDTFFPMPAFSQVAGIFGIIHILILLSLLPMIFLRAIQVSKNLPHVGVKPKTLCIVKVTVAFVSVLFAILVAIFASVGENRPAEYTIKKGWSFWLQISVIVADIIITMVCVMENFLFWQQHIQEHVDVDGTRAETYGNPTFDSGSPEPNRRYSSDDGLGIAYTETSGDPYYYASNGDSGFNPGARPTFEKNGRKKQHKAKKEQRTSREVLTYENESYREHSPKTRHSRRNERFYPQ